MPAVLMSPPIIGWFKDYTGSYAGGLYALAGFAALAAIISAICVRETPVTFELESLQFLVETLQRLQPFVGSELRLPHGGYCK